MVSSHAMSLCFLVSTFLSSLPTMVLEVTLGTLLEPVPIEGN